VISIFLPWITSFIELPPFSNVGIVYTLAPCILQNTDFQNLFNLLTILDFSCVNIP
jgi:hypothetical protein